MTQRVLVVDDDPWLLDQYAATLKQAGYAVDTAANALDAMTALDRGTPQAIVLDLFMPGPNALVLLHELRSHSDLAAVPVILATNAAAELSPAELSSYGVVQLLDKTTMQPSDIITAIKRHT